MTNPREDLARDRAGWFPGLVRRKRSDGADLKRADVTDLFVTMAEGTAAAADAALSRVEATVEPSGVRVSRVGLPELGARLAAPGTRALVLHEGLEEALYAALEAGASPLSVLSAKGREAAAIAARLTHYEGKGVTLSVDRAARDPFLGVALKAALGIDGADQPPLAAARDPLPAALVSAIAAHPEAVRAVSALKPFELPGVAPAFDLSAAFDAYVAEPAKGTVPPRPGIFVDGTDAELPQTPEGLRDALLRERALRRRLGEEVGLLQEALGGAFTDTETLPHQTIAVDDLDEAAFYGLERRSADGLPFRWIGKERTAVHLTDLPRAGPAMVEVVLAVVISPASLTGFSFTLDGVAPAFVETVNEGGSVTLRGYFDTPAEQNSLGRTRLTLEAGHVEDLSASGDPRCLAVGVHKVTVSALKDLDLAALAQSVRQMVFHADTFTSPAFHALERVGEGPLFRWMGKRTEALFRTEVRQFDPLVVTVEMPVALNRATVDALEIFIDDRHGAAITRETADGVLVREARFEAPTDRATQMSPVTVRLVAGRTAGPFDHDQRILAVAISRVTVQSLHEDGDSAPS